MMNSRPLRDPGQAAGGKRGAGRPPDPVRDRYFAKEPMASGAGPPENLPNS
jgi:hypothetical protein